MCSTSFTEISTWRASSQHWRAMSSLRANGASSRPSPVSKSQQVRPAPSSAWISPTKMPCISAAGVLAGVLVGRRERVDARHLGLALRGSKMTSSMRMWSNRSSRASSSTGSMRFMSNLLGAAPSPQRRLPGRTPGSRVSYDHSSEVMASRARGRWRRPGRTGRLGRRGRGPWWPWPKAGRADPGLERRLVAPAGDHQPGGAVVGRAGAARSPRTRPGGRRRRPGRRSAGPARRPTRRAR